MKTLKNNVLQNILFLFLITSSFVSYKLNAQVSNPQAIDLVQSFGQGKVILLNPEYQSSKAGNCVSIGYIKASVEVFGLGNVFEYSVENNTYNVILKDSSRVTFTFDELKQSTVAAGFSKEKRPSNISEDKQKLYNSIYDYTNVAFCVIVKKYQAIHKVSFVEALDRINMGVNVRCFPKYLGIQYYTKYEGWKGNNKSRRGEVAWLKNHVVYTSSGIVDYYGNPFERKPIRYPKRIKIYKTPFDTEQYLGEKNCFQ